LTSSEGIPLVTDQPPPRRF